MPKDLQRWSMRLAAVVAVLLVAVCVVVGRDGLRDLYDTWTKGRLVFRDDFSGPSLNATLWNTTIATEGVRWCAVQGSKTGEWIDISSKPYRGGMQEAPYGVVSQGGGVARFRTHKVSGVYPYIWAGAPSRGNPFPESGDFRFEVKLKYDSLGYSGAGVRLRDWKNSDPIGNNSYGGEGRILTIRGGGRGLRIGLLDITEQTQPPDPFGACTVRLDYIDGEYSLFVNGEARLRPTASSQRPRMISIGDPIFSGYTSRRPWPEFSVDYVHVRIP